MEQFADYLDTLDEPVVLLLYGDHKPWMGNNGSMYAELGISLDTTTEEGFRNYYSTWYLIWATRPPRTCWGRTSRARGRTCPPAS